MARGETRDLVADLAGGVREVYYLYGAERTLLERALTTLRDRALDGAPRDLACDVLDAREHEEVVSAAIAAARTPAFLARRRVVIVRGAETFDAAALEAIAAYAEKPSPIACLVLVGGEKIDARLKVFLRLAKAGTLYQFEPPRGGLAGLAHQEAKARGVRLDPDAAERLADAVGGDLGQLAQAVERCAMYVHPETRIREEDVETVVATTRRASIFDLMNAVGKRDPDGALLALADMVRYGKRGEGLRVVAMLQRHVRQLWQAKEAVARRVPRTELPRILGVNPYFVDGILAQARAFSLEELRRAVESLYETDRALKGGKLDEETVLERTVLSLAGVIPRAS